MEKQKWYVLYVRMHHERKTAETLKERGITCYLPVQEVVRQWSDRKKRLKKVVIPMVLFVYTDEGTRLELVRSIPSVTGTLMDRGTKQPAVIRDTEMERFMFMLDYSEKTVRFQAECLRPGEKIHVIKGPLTGLDAEMVEIEGKSQVIVRLDKLGCASVEMPIGFVTRIE